MKNTMKELKTITVADGYNGHTVELFLSPILDQDEYTVKLKVAEKGKEHMFRWVRKTDLVSK